MPACYMDLMEKALSAYSEAHIRRYFDQVRADGLKEHGFPRLTANIGILIAHGRRQDLLPLFLGMMDLCCEQIPKRKAANDFSVREIVCCMRELEGSGIVEQTRLNLWRQQFAAIDPWTCYSVTAKTPEDPVRNWALFSGVSEFFRQQYGLCRSEEFIDLQIASQLKWFDQNGMYMDNDHSVFHQPMVYDLVARGLFTLLLHEGYRGKYYDTIDGYLRKAGLLSLRMQSVSGELPYGGRSNQFLHNEAWLAALFEYEARRWAGEGNAALSAAFKGAAHRAWKVVEAWLEKKPIRHLKNRFPTQTGFGCEKYAYFDKYMITTASFLYAAYLMCDDSLPAAPWQPAAPEVLETSQYFHKMFLHCGEYSAELDWNGDPHYDAGGLGRLHRKDAPSAIALSVPCPANPNYALGFPQPMPLSVCPGILREGSWQFAAGEGVRWERTALERTESHARAELLCHFGDTPVDVRYTLTGEGMTVEIHGDGAVACLLPAFSFDGEAYTQICAGAQSLSVVYNGWECRYTTDGQIRDLETVCGNRNGHYKAFAAQSRQALRVHIEISRMQSSC